MSKDFNQENDNTPKPKMDDWEKDVIDIVQEEWTKGRQYCSDMNNLYEDIYKMFRGGRPDKGYDWESDISLRKAFQIAWTTVTYLIRKIYGASPVVGVKGFDQKGCWQREVLLEKWGERDEAFTTHVMSILRLVLNGVVFRKKTWEQELQPGPNGIQIPIKDHPHDAVLSNKDVVVDWSLAPGQSCKEGRFVLHQDMVDLGSLYGSRVNYRNLDKIKGSSAKAQHEANHSSEKGEDDQDNKPESPLYRDILVRERQGIFAVKTEDEKLIPIFDPEEMYGKEGVEFKQMIAVIADPDGDPQLIRWEENPYGEITIYDGHMYYDPERWHSSGQIEPAKDIINAQDDNVNAMFDEIWQNMFPPVIANKFGLVEWDTVERSPGAIWKVGGNPNEQFMFTRPGNISGDAWMKNQFLDSESQLTTSVTQNIQGQGKDKTATVGVLNAQYSSDKMDFLVMMYEKTVMKPDAEMSIKFAQKFGTPLMFISILGEPFKFDTGWKEEYKFQPVASSVKQEQQKEIEIQQDIQLLQIVQSMNNPKTAAVVNKLLANILRNRDMPIEGAQLDEDYFEPQGDAGMMQMLNGGMAGAKSNQNGVGMSAPERSVRGNTFKPRGLLN